MIFGGYGLYGFVGVFIPMLFLLSIFSFVVYLNDKIELLNIPNEKIYLILSLLLFPFGLVFVDIVERDVEKNIPPNTP